MVAENYRPDPPPATPADRDTFNWTFRQMQSIAAAIAETNRRWERFAEFTLDTFTVAAYGSVRMSTEQPGPDIGAAWQPLAFMDDVAIPSLLMDVAAPGTFTVDYAGVYNLQTEIGFEHNELNAGRTTYLRLFNVTDGVPVGLQTAIGVARNVDVTQWTGNLLFDLDEAATNNVYRWEIGGGSAFSAINWLTQSLSVNQVGQWKGPDLW